MWRGLVARLALELTTSVRDPTVRVSDLEREITVVGSVAGASEQRPPLSDPCVEELRALASETAG